MEVVLNQEEMRVLTRLVQGAVEEIRQEIRHTHESDLKEDLKHREHVLCKLLDRFSIARCA